MTRRYGFFRHAFLLSVLSLGLGLAGCEGDDGANGQDGADGVDGADGIACWDLNGNGIGDPGEDLNGDGVVDVKDCNALASGAYEVAQLHAGWFATYPYVGTESCLDCHGKLAEEVLTTAHFQWQGVAQNIVGDAQGNIHGKRDILNNFCIAVPSNEGRCTQCHAGYGWADNTFDFEDPENIDCLVCHDQTFDEGTLLGTYVKAPTTAGLPANTAEELNLVAQSVAMGQPTIRNCIRCHANAGGGDNVKHGDLAMSLKNTTAEYDVHMGTADSGGLDFECVTCHRVDRTPAPESELLSHGIGGMPYHSVEEGDMQGCDDCHGSALIVHAGLSVEPILQSHERLACQTCHIPAFARQTSTKTEWYWDTAGEVRDPIPPDPVDPTRPSFDRKKGDFVWAFNVRPTLRFFDGTWEKAIIGVNDTYAVGEGTPENPVVLGAPVGDCSDPNDMIYPFKKMIGNQPADVVNRRILVPHLFGGAGGPNAFWGNWDWDGALLDAAAITGQPYVAGDFGFVNTAMYLAVNHEIAPQEQAFGFGGVAACGDCHFDAGIDWTELGYTGDPADPNNPGVCPE
jgi:octaheme c-type cytochrome (tetrathionate reductase family)